MSVSNRFSCLFISLNQTCLYSTNLVGKCTGGTIVSLLYPARKMLATPEKGANKEKGGWRGKADSETPWVWGWEKDSLKGKTGGIKSPSFGLWRRININLLGGFSFQRVALPTLGRFLLWRERQGDETGNASATRIGSVKEARPCSNASAG